MFEGQLQTEVTVRLPVAVCLMPCCWFTSQGVTSAKERFCSLAVVPFSLEKGIVSPLLVQTATKRKERRKTKGKPITIGKTGPLGWEGFWQKGMRKKNPNPVLWVVQILASCQIYSLKSEKKKQCPPILQASVQEICKPGSSKYLAGFLGGSWMNTQAKIICSSCLQCCGGTPS